jgi:hypothetical protein
MPHHVIDLWTEYRAITNGKRRRKERTRLIDALTYYRCDYIGAVEKTELQQLAMRGPPYTETEKQALLNYCESDVDALFALLSRMAEDLQAFHPQEMLFRGRSMVAQTRSDRVGIPVDMPLIRAILEHREAIRTAVIAQYETRHRWGIFEDGIFRLERYATWLCREQIRLPVTGKSRQPTKDEKILEKYADKYPQLGPLRECLRTLSALSRFKLPERADGRSRFFANNFGTVTGRNAPAASEFLFLLPGWAKFLIKPPPGWGVGYIDIARRHTAKRELRLLACMIMPAVTEV